MPDLPALMDCLYTSEGDDRAVFVGERYRPPRRFEHGRWYQVCGIPKEKDGDGQPVEIDECRLPARFYRLRALASTNSVGRPRAPYYVTTGSGTEVGRVLVRLGRQIAQGMCTFHEGEAPADG